MYSAPKKATPPSSAAAAAAPAAAPSASDIADSMAGLSLAMPSLAASHSASSAVGPFSAVPVDADTFRDVEHEVYRSLGASAELTLGESSVYRSVGHSGHVSSAQFEDMNAFAMPSLSHSHSSSGAASAAVAVGVTSLSANPFQPLTSFHSEVNAAVELGFKPAKLGSSSAAASLNPKHEFGSVSVDDEDAALPPEVPEYLEPSYHFAVAAQVRAMDFVAVLLPVLASFRVDYSAPVIASDRAFKIKCVAYGSGASAGVDRVPFVVSLFRFDKAGLRIVAEFQRRSGCIMTFSNLYRRIKTELQQKGLLAAPAARSGVAVSAAPANAALAAPALSRFTEVMPVPAELPALDSADITPAQAKKTVDLLLEMVASEFTDVKLKAISMLSELTADRVYGDALAGGVTAAAVGNFDSVLKALSHTNEDVQRCALTTVGNLTAIQRVDLCTSVLASSSAVVGVSTVLGAPASAASMQSIREAARVLANVVETVGCGAGSGRVETGVAHAAIEALTRSTDSIARSHATRLERAVPSAPSKSKAAPASAAAASPSGTAKANALPSELSMPSLGFGLRQ